MQFDFDALQAIGVELVVLFGSRARGQQRPGSDLDLGVLFRPTIVDPLDLLDRVQDLISADAPVDLVSLNDADPLLQREVAMDGEAMFQGYPGAFEEFRLRAIKLFMDTQWLRDAEAAALRSRYG